MTSTRRPLIAERISAIGMGIAEGSITAVGHHGNRGPRAPGPLAASLTPPGGKWPTGAFSARHSPAAPAAAPRCREAMARIDPSPLLALPGVRPVLAALPGARI